MGADIDSACGQLVKKIEEEEKKEEIDIEDVGVQKSAPVANTKKGKVVVRQGKTKSTAKASASWIESLGDDELSQLEHTLSLALGISASCFLLSSLVCFKKR